TGATFPQRRRKPCDTSDGDANGRREAGGSVAPSDPLHLAARRAGSGSGWAKLVADGWPAGERLLFGFHESLLAGCAVGRDVGGGLPRRDDHPRGAGARTATRGQGHAGFRLISLDHLLRVRAAGATFTRD